MIQKSNNRKKHSLKMEDFVWITI